MSSFVTVKTIPPGIVLFTFNGVPGEGDWARYEQMFHYVYKTLRDVVLVYDLSHIGQMPLEYAMKKAQMMRDIAPFSGQRILGTVVLARHAFVNMLLQMVFKMQKPVSPSFIVDNTAAAALHARFLLENALRLPSAAESVVALNESARMYPRWGELSRPQRIWWGVLVVARHNLWRAVARFRDARFWPMPPSNLIPETRA